MFSTFVYAMGFILVASSLLALRLPTRDRVFSLSLLRSLVALPFLTGQYIYLAYHLTTESAAPVLLFEAQFSILWGWMAYRIVKAMDSKDREPYVFCLAEFIAGMGCFACLWLLTDTGPSRASTDTSLIMGNNSYAYLFSFLALISMLTMAWRLEVFWRNLEPMRRWEHKLLVVACYLICCALIWACSYRLTYLQLVDDHFALLASLLALGWGMTAYAVGRHRLLNRKLFISRKIVYASVAPFILAVYLTGLGLVVLISQVLGWSIHTVVFMFLGAVGCVAAGLYWCSGQLRKKVHYFISTHFYVNKYEYRDEWLALSSALRGATSEADIIRALSQVLAECLYVSKVVIWLERAGGCYTSVRSGDGNPAPEAEFQPHENDPLIEYVRENGTFYLGERGYGERWEELAAIHGAMLRKAGVVLITPIVAGDHVLGLIGIGEENTGGKFGLDDFDLLSAIGAQTASALLAARRADELIRLKEKQAFDTLSAFVLHDVKNAASMLSLVRTNAAEHIHDPEFQEDMLDAIDNALKRMGKVQEHLATFKGDIRPVCEEVELCSFMGDVVEELLKKLTGLRVTLVCTPSVSVALDKGIFSVVLENLLLNSLQAGGDGTEVVIEVSQTHEQELHVVLTDDGPGIAEGLLPERLFDPFQSTRGSGSGIGLWQARELLSAMGGTIRAENSNPGARFFISLPKRYANL